MIKQNPAHKIVKDACLTIQLFLFCFNFALLPWIKMIRNSCKTALWNFILLREFLNVCLE